MRVGKWQRSLIPGKVEETMSDPRQTVGCRDRGPPDIGDTTPGLGCFLLVWVGLALFFWLTR